MSPLPQGFGGLSKPAAPKPATPVASPQQTPAPGNAKPALAPVAKPVAAPAPAKPLVRPVAAAAAPVKSKAQLMREEAERLEAEEAAQSVVNQESADLAKEAELVHEATVEPEAEPVATTPPSKDVSLTANPFSAALAIYQPESAVNALAAFAEIAEQQRVISLYPVLTVSGGDQGGMFVAPKWQADEINHRLPEGRKPLPIVYLGYRIEVSIWPVGYDPASQDRDAPLATAVIPCNDTDTIRLMTKATQTYQFTAKANKSKFDAIANEQGQMIGSGHPRPTIEIIAYAPCLKNILVIRSAPGFGPVQKSVSNLARLVDPVSKTIPLFPGEIRVTTDEEKSKSGQVWKTHYFDFASNLTVTGQALAKEFDAFSKVFMADASGMTTFNEWMTGGDKKITDEIRARLLLTCQV